MDLAILFILSFQLHALSASQVYSSVIIHSCQMSLTKVASDSVVNEGSHSHSQDYSEIEVSRLHRPSHQLAHLYIRKDITALKCRIDLS